jgi:Uma2 family endonuclease
MMPDDCPCPFLAARTLTVGKSSTLPSGPTWEIAHLFPSQGHWSEEEYLALETNRRIEFTHGVLEFLPMPTTSHQFIIAYLYGLLTTFVTASDLGIALFAGVRVKVAKGKFREPDIIYMANEHVDRVEELFWTGADLAMEIVSGSAKDRERDLTEKRSEYARAKISEYWIVEPREERITVLRLAGKQYVVHGEFAGGETATSVLLPGFAVDVSAVFAQKLARRRRGKRPSK